ncbi:hypothetical protein NOCARDAX2BIS_160053 [Nocardioides sp. AX2bis]|nr:hypothetical protein NOCARDAX2BIS_160053 [Nocardioides sp. AX2bis]
MTAPAPGTRSGLSVQRPMRTAGRVQPPRPARRSIRPRPGPQPTTAAPRPAPVKEAHMRRPMSCEPTVKPRRQGRGQGHSPDDRTHGPHAIIVRHGHPGRPSMASGARSSSAHDAEVWMLVDSDTAVTIGPAPDET